MPPTATTINFPGDKKTILKIEAAKRDMTMERLIVECFEAYIASDNPKRENGALPAKPQAQDPIPILEPSISDEHYVTLSIPKRFIPWVQKLLVVLLSRKQVIVRAIKSNLEAFASLAGEAADGAVDGVPIKGNPSAEAQRLARESDQLMSEADAALEESARVRRGNNYERKRARGI